jgi:hypothetical protein
MPAGPLEPAPDVLDLVIPAGFQAAKMLRDENRATLRKQLIAMNTDLKGKTKTEIFNAVFDAWEAESIPEIKAAWALMMNDKNLQ